MMDFDVQNQIAHLFHFFFHMEKTFFNVEHQIASHC